MEEKEQGRERNTGDASTGCWCCGRQIMPEAMQNMRPEDMAKMMQGMSPDAMTSMMKACCPEGTDSGDWAEMMRRMFGGESEKPEG